MTTYNSHYLNSDLHIAKVKTGTISGSVTKSGSGIKRRLLLYKEPYATVIDQIWSDPDTGEYSFSISYVGALDKFTIICKGEDGENDLIFTDVAVVFS